MGPGSLLLRICLLFCLTRIPPPHPRACSTLKPTPTQQLDPPDVDRVMMGLEEVLTAKNGAISDLQYAFVRTAKGYNDSLRTYTAKLKACGVPAEEIAGMGFAPYTTSTSLGPAGLVVR